MTKQDRFNMRNWNIIIKPSITSHCAGLKEKNKLPHNNKYSPDISYHSFY